MAVSDVVDGAGAPASGGGTQDRNQIVDMDAVAPGRLVGPHQRGLGQAVQRQPAGAVDAADTQDGQGHAVLGAPVAGDALCREAALRALAARRGRARLVNPFALAIAVDAGGAQVDQPARDRFLAGAQEVAQARVVRLRYGRRRDQVEHRPVGRGGRRLVDRPVEIVRHRRDAHPAEAIGRTLRAHEPDRALAVGDEPPCEATANVATTRNQWCGRRHTGGSRSF